MTVKKRKPKVPYGLKVTGVIRVFAKEKTVKVQGVETQIVDTWFNVSNKIDEGKYENKSMKIFFNHQIGIPENNTEVEIIDSWFMLTGQGEYQQISLYVKEWEYKE